MEFGIPLARNVAGAVAAPPPKSISTSTFIIMPKPPAGGKRRGEEELQREGSSLCVIDSLWFGVVVEAAKTLFAPVPRE